MDALSFLAVVTLIVIGGFAAYAVLRQALYDVAKQILKEMGLWKKK